MTTAPDAPTPPARRRRRRGWLLAISLILNVFLLAVVVGGIARTAGPWGPPGMSPERATSWSEHRRLHALSGDQRTMVREAFAHHRDALRDQGRALHEARREVRAALAAEPFDRARLAAAFAALRSVTGAGQAALHTVLIDIAAQLPAEARTVLAPLAEPGGPPPRRERSDD